MTNSSGVFLFINMATVKIKFRPSCVPDKEGTLFYQVTHRRMARQISIRCKVHPYEWDDARSEILLPDGVSGNRRRYLLSLRKSLLEGIGQLQRIIDRLDRTGEVYTSDTVVQQFCATPGGDTLQAFAASLIAELRHAGKVCVADRYATTMNSFSRFYGRGGILLNAVDAGLIMQYEGYLKAQGICPNTSSYYMRSLRAIYNRAVEKGAVVQQNPFKHVYTGVGKTVKRAISLKTLRLIKSLDLSAQPSVDYARDIFLFSFYTRGMSFVDMAFLKKRDLRNGKLSYRRQKTSQQLCIKWEKQMQDIVDKYDTSDTPYLLPIIKNVAVDGRRQYKSAFHFVNAKLKLLGKQLGLPIPLTTYVARHTWASIAKSKNISISVISEAMGHDSEQTTRIYLASLDTSVVDRANSLILKSL